MEKVIKLAIMEMRTEHIRTLFHVTSMAAQTRMNYYYEEYERAVFDAMCSEKGVVDSAYENLKEELY